MGYLKHVINWSEVWSLLIPLIVYLFIRPKAKWVKPVVYFLIIALVCCLCIDIIWYRKKIGIDSWFQNNLSWWYNYNEDYKVWEFKNSVFYNLMSLVRLFMFTWFFSYFGNIFKKLNKYVRPLFVLLIIVNFIWLEDIKDLSSVQLATEAGILLVYSLIFFYKSSTDDSTFSHIAMPYHWVTAGLTLYTSINFFIFLFYNYMLQSPIYKKYLNDIWNVHNASFILLNIFIAISFYRSKKHE